MGLWGALDVAAEALLWPIGIRKKRRGTPSRDDASGRAGGGGDELRPARSGDDGEWEVDHVHFVGVLSGAVLAYWALGRIKSSQAAAPIVSPNGSGNMVVAALPRIPLSDFLVLLRAGTVTAVTYLASSPPAGSLVLQTSTPRSLAAAGAALLAPAVTVLSGGAAAPTVLATPPVSSAARDLLKGVGCGRAETLLLPGCHQGIFEELRARDGLLFECAELSVGDTDSDVSKLSLLVDVVGLLASLAALAFLLRGSGSGTFSGSNLAENSGASADLQRSGVTFEDVAGMENTKEELAEVISFLQNPSSFSALGARTPRGILLTGPSGTGKTLLARAVAGEAGVPFLYASSASFVEVFVGQGAQRVRQFFEQARSCAPCIVFFDELDALGAARQSGASGGNQEYAQTLNQLLMELDGVESHSGGGAGQAQPVVVTMGATNRYDCLDEALVRPGRFDRIVNVGLPNLAERVATLRVHSRKLKTEDLDLDAIARRTAGSSGADLANLLNEAGLLAARRRADAVRMEHVEEVLGNPRPRQRAQGQASPDEGVSAGPEQFMQMVAAMAEAMAAGMGEGRATPGPVITPCN